MEKNSKFRMIFARWLWNWTNGKSLQEMEKIIHPCNSVIHNQNLHWYTLSKKIPRNQCRNKFSRCDVTFLVRGLCKDPTISVPALAKMLVKYQGVEVTAQSVCNTLRKRKLGVDHLQGSLM